MDGDYINVPVYDPWIGIVQMELPGAARIFIMAFDTSCPEERVRIEPISFTIDVPYSLIDKIGIGEVYRILSESKTLELVQP